MDSCDANTPRNSDNDWRYVDPFIFVVVLLCFTNMTSFKSLYIYMCVSVYVYNKCWIPLISSCAYNFFKFELPSIYFCVMISSVHWWICEDGRAIYEGDVTMFVPLELLNFVFMKWIWIAKNIGLKWILWMISFYFFVEISLFFVLSKDHPGYKANSIYFIDDYWDRVNKITCMGFIIWVCYAWKMDVSNTLVSWFAKNDTTNILDLSWLVTIVLCASS